MVGFQLGGSGEKEARLCLMDGGSEVALGLEGERGHCW